MAYRPGAGSRGFMVAVLLLMSFRAYAGLTCGDLDGAYVYAQDSSSQPTYLGFFGSEFATNSIMNQFGPYGSEFSATSVRNPNGQFGSAFGIYSAQNPNSTMPPAVYKGQGCGVVYLTTNTLFTYRVSLAAIDSSCTFFSLAPDTTTPCGVGAPSQVFADGFE